MIISVILALLLYSTWKPWLVHFCRHQSENQFVPVSSYVELSPQSKAFYPSCEWQIYQRNLFLDLNCGNLEGKHEACISLRGWTCIRFQTLLNKSGPTEKVGWLKLVVHSSQKNKQQFLTCLCDLQFPVCPDQWSLHCTSSPAELIPENFFRIKQRNFSF